MLKETKARRKQDCISEETRGMLNKISNCLKSPKLTPKEKSDP